MSELVKKLLFGETRIVVFGAGYIGYSTAAFYAKNGIHSILIDIDEEKVNKINKGQPPYPELQGWLGFNVAPISHLIEATTDWTEATKPETKVIFICVNTEHDAKPWTDALKDVCQKIANHPEDPLIIIESTMAPGWVDTIVRPILFGRIAVAPRRDWFTLPGMTVETLDRVVGATDPETLTEAISVLGIISKKIHPASDHKVAEMVKSIENAFRHVGIALSYQLAVGFPHIDTREALRLAATKWNMELYQPSTGIGGYCLPLAPKYLLSATDTDISIFEEAIKADKLMPYQIGKNLKKNGVESACILGIAYKGDLKVHIASPGLRLAAVLESMEIRTSIHDPLYDSEEIRKLSSANPVNSLTSLHLFDAIIVTCDHIQYKTIDQEQLLNGLTSCKIILDAHGVWEKYRDLFEEKGIHYRVIGEPDWIDPSDL